MLRARELQRTVGGLVAEAMSYAISRYYGADIEAHWYNDHRRGHRACATETDLVGELALLSGDGQKSGHEHKEGNRPPEHISRDG